VTAAPRRRREAVAANAVLQSAIGARNPSADGGFI
jgi:hypothetical protein